MFEQGDIVIAPFPFTDLSTIKQRPCFIISNNNYNRKTQDVMICAITSNLENKENSVLIDSSSLKEGTIPLKSRIKVGKIYTLEQSLIIKKVASTKKEISESVKEELFKIL